MTARGLTGSDRQNGSSLSVAVFLFPPGWDLNDPLQPRIVKKFSKNDYLPVSVMSWSTVDLVVCTPLPKISTVKAYSMN